MQGLLGSSTGEPTLPFWNLLKEDPHGVLSLQSEASSCVFFLTCPKTCFVDFCCCFLKLAGFLKRLGN